MSQDDRNHSKRKGRLEEDDESVMHKSVSGARSEQSELHQVHGPVRSPLEVGHETKHA